MRVMLLVDVEGVSQVDDVRAASWNYPELYAQTQIDVTLDTNAAIRGLRAAGATEIIVADGHGARVRPHNFNLLPERLEPDVKLVRGASHLEAAKGLDALAMVGMHCRNGTPIGFMGHTTSGFTAVTFNGEWFGEVAMLAAVAGERGVPTILVTGDDATIRENHAFMPWIETAVVKTATGRTSCDCLSGDVARAQIETAARCSLEQLASMKPLVVATPVETEVWFPSLYHADLAEIIPGSRRVSETAIAQTSESFFDARRFFSTALRLASGVRASGLMKTLMDDPETAAGIIAHHRKEQEDFWKAPPWITVELPRQIAENG